jgi:hypothetical protein
MIRRRTSAESGQILVIFAFAFIAVLMMLALLFDGARALVLRRQLQDASDAAALAGANVIQGLSPKGCSATVGPPPGAPMAQVIAAAKASVAANLPNYPQSAVVVTCVPDATWMNYAVKVSLGDFSPTFFGSIMGGGPLAVNVDSSAVNGNAAGNQYSVVLLDPSHLTWPNGQRGCPSFLLSGGPTVRFDSAIYIDSSCTAVNGGAFSTNGNSASLTQGAGSFIRIVGEYKPQALTISPPPIEHSQVKQDPLAFLVGPPINSAAPPSLVVRSNNKLVIGQGNSSSTVVLEPGIYKGGIQLKNQSIAYLHPGIYVFDGGGLSLGAGQRVYTLPTSKVNTTDATWATDCPSPTSSTPANMRCGVLFYNTGTSGSGSGAMGQITVGAQSTFKVRSYDPDGDTTLMTNGTTYRNDTYKNLLIWQSKAPIPTSTYQQPLLALTGGGNVFMAGTVYAPSAKTQMGGNSGGSGGDTIDLTLQFIVWDLELYGNSNFYFRYSADKFAHLLDYGLIE